MEETFSPLIITGGRIKEERVRLKLSQAEAAAQCACVRETWGKYERGVFDMNTETLRAFAALGADMLYILTGKRGVQLAPPALTAQQETAGYAVEVLSREEFALLDNYRNSPDVGKRAIQGAGLAVAQPLKKSNK